MNFGPVFFTLAHPPLRLERLIPCLFWIFLLPACSPSSPSSSAASSENSDAISTASQPATSDSPVLAKVGSQLLTEEQFLAAAQASHGQYLSLDEKMKFLQALIDEAALYRLAQEQKLDQDPDVQRAIRSLVVGKLKERQLQQTASFQTISPGEIEAKYKEFQDRYSQPERRRLAVIQVKKSPQLSADDLKQLRQKISEAHDQALTLAPDTASRGFGSLASTHSDDPSTSLRGGDSGWLTQQNTRRWPQVVLDAGFSLEPIGAISPVLETDAGLYLVRLIDIQKRALTPLPAMETTLRQQIIREKRQKIQDDLIEQARSATPITIHTQLLEAVKISPNPIPPAPIP